MRSRHTYGPFAVTLLGLATLIAAPLATYERELTSLQVRDAVFLGRANNARTAEFLKDYVQAFPASRSGVYLSRVEVSTPYKQIVERARRAPSGSYSALQAQSDYELSPRRLLLELTFLRTLATPPQPSRAVRLLGSESPLDLLERFTYGVAQGEREVPVFIQLIDGIYDCGPWGCFLTGTRVQLAAEVAAVESAPLELEVAAPDGQIIRARFDLASLR
jgi:hypothetical protein